MTFRDAATYARAAGIAEVAKSGKDYWTDKAYALAVSTFYALRPNHQGEDRITEVLNAIHAAR